MSSDLSICEACEREPTVVDEPDSDGTAFLVCLACHRRLIAYALRPREWFNLAKRHGPWQFLLHDDFYDQDGTAGQPHADVVDPELHPAPTLDEMCGDAESLLDYSYTRLRMTDDLAAAWRQLDRESVLAVISERYTDACIERKAVMLEVAACSLAERGEGLVTAAWNDFTDHRLLNELAHASSACLSEADGISRVMAALDGYDENIRRESMYALSYFRSPLTLDWIERHICSPITENSGRLAAASQFSWPRAVEWLKRGRPLSLVALDALLENVRPQSPLLRYLGPIFVEPPDESSFESTLNEYLERDNAWRAKSIVQTLLKHRQKLTVR